MINGDRYYHGYVTKQPILPIQPKEPVKSKQTALEASATKVFNRSCSLEARKIPSLPLKNQESAVSRFLGLDTWKSEGKTDEAKQRIIECVLKQRESLDLSGLGLSTLPEKMFKQLDCLKQFTCDSNSWKSLPGSIQKITTLHHLDPNEQKSSLPPIQAEFKPSVENIPQQVEPFSWGHLDPSNKELVVSTLLNCFKEEGEKNCKGSLQISVGNKTIDLHYAYKAKGSSGLVFVVSVGEVSFALKVLNPGTPLGHSGKTLVNHSIVGLVTLYSADVLTINNESRTVITMGLLKETWEEMSDRKDPRLSDLKFLLLRMKRLLQTLIDLEKIGFVHGNIGSVNLMFDEQGEVYIVDIDMLPSVNDEYAAYKTSTDLSCIHGFLDVIFSQEEITNDHPLMKFRLGKIPATPEAYLKKLNEVTASL